MSTATLPDRAQVVVVGGGVVGCSVAYHLTRLGVADVLLLEQGALSCGTTWHAAGLVGPLRASEAGTRLVQYSAELYAALEAETGLATGYKNHGGLIVARTPERLTQLRRTAGNGLAYGLPCEVVSPERAQELWPPMAVDDLLGALWLPGDGTVNPTDLTQALARGARDRGARIVERTRVLGFDTEATASGPRVVGVRVSSGGGDHEGDVHRVAAEQVVLCAGQWTKALGDQVGATVPLHSAEHFYVVTEAVDGVHGELPIMRDPDGWTYFKEEVGGLVVGAFEPHARAWRSPSDLPHPFEFALLGEDWEHFAPVMEQAVRRVPALAETGIRRFYDGPESFTPDNQFLLGETPAVRGLFVGAGFNSVGIASAGGAGRALAEWVVAGEPQEDLAAVDVRRFGPHAADESWLRERVVETLGLHYAVPWPDREPTTGRGQRRSPLHDRLAARGAVFGTRMGWERPLLFAPGVDAGHEGSGGVTTRHTWGRPWWSPWSTAEQRACRTAAALFDQTSFSVYGVSGAAALALLETVCAADVDVPTGGVVYTAWLNRRGGFEADLTVTRTGDDAFLVVSSSATTVRDLDWLRRHVPAGADVVVADLTDERSVLGLMGPRSRTVLATVSGADLSDGAFPFSTSQELTISGAVVRATRITYVGEVGWELMVAMADAPAVFDALHEVGDDVGLVDAGYHAIESLRLEKGYRAFGRELGPDRNPVQAGLLFATALSPRAGSDKPFLGREALERARADAVATGGPTERVVSLVLDPRSAPDAHLWGGEALLRDGEVCGQVTSGAWGATVGACVGLAVVRRPDGVTRAWLAEGSFQVDVAGVRHRVGLSFRAPLG